MKDQDKKVVSPFEFAIAEAIDPEAAKTMRPETEQERYARVYKDFKNIALKLRVINPDKNTK
ncbi:hypothetical protein CMT89_08355 [Elizabethkingia anophelis]|nr:hypothetical protein [Elizabethkingia anophelis]MDV4058421.1 hypothetical protein [Elizabethkingia anophelis]